MRTNARTLGTGVALAALLAVGSLAIPLAPGARRVLYDSITAPPPVYHWVRPPTDVVAAAEPPLEGVGVIETETPGSKASSVGTGDAQATAVFPAGVFPASAGQIRVTITATDPAALPEPPEGLVLDGNAYTIEAASQGTRTSLASKATIALRYPIRATRLLRLDGGSWRELRSTVVRASLIVYADSSSLGTFAAAGPPPPSPYRAPTIPVAAAAAVGALVLAHIARLRAARRSRSVYAKTVV